MPIYKHIWRIFDAHKNPSNMLKYIGPAPTRIDSKKRYFKMAKYQCACGTIFDTMVCRVKSGQAKTCGCSRGGKHGLCSHPLYGVWRDMKQRCLNPKCASYPRYGGRGISVCSVWEKSFIKFYNWAIANGWEKGLELDRIDNDGNYSEDNCRFVTCKVNIRNSTTAKLTWKEVNEIRANLDGLSRKELSKKYGTSNRNLSSIINYESWK